MNLRLLSSIVGLWAVAHLSINEFERDINKMLIFDAHCDTVTECMDRKAVMKSNDLHVDFDRMKQMGDVVQFFALFVHPHEYRGRELLRFIQAFDSMHIQIEKPDSGVKICKCHADILAAHKENKTAALISIENGGFLQGDAATLRMLYRLGIRCICLAWNYTNELADGVLDAASDNGLTAFGREIVAEMNRLGILIDVSHLSPKSFWNVMESTYGPLIASHSNAKEICGHPRNLDDNQIRALSDRNGVIGINLYPDFLSNSKKASIDDIVSHIEHITALTGENHVGLGADFDGVETLPEGINGIQDINKIFEKLAQLNYSNQFIEKFAGNNFMRIVKDVIG